MNPLTTRSESVYERVRQQSVDAATQLANHAFMMILKHHGLIEDGQLLVDSSLLNAIHHPISGGRRVILVMQGKPIGQYDLVSACGNGSLTHHIANFSFTPQPDVLRAATANL